MSRPCIRCGVLTTRTRCVPCARAWERTRRPPRSARGYDQVWQRISKAARAAQPWCSRCGSPFDLTVDHVLPHSLLGGVRVLCRSCHGQIGARTDRPTRDQAGWGPVVDWPGSPDPRPGFREGVIYAEDRAP
jgi:5-methylcytosine-specific restriction endonuclease McrA